MNIIFLNKVINTTIKSKFYNAFSLIELMIVIAITAIITVVAIPNYRAYVTRANVTAMLSILDSCQSLVYRYYIQNGSLPNGVDAGQIITCQGVNIRTSTMLTIPNTGASKIKAKYNLIAIPAGNTSSIFTVTHDDVIESGAKCQLYLTLTLPTGSSNGELESSCSTNCSTRAFFPSTCTISAATLVVT